MEFGMFHEFPTSAGHTETEAFETALAEVDAAEAWGLDAIWLAELHFAPKRSLLSAPLTVASVIAARTRRIKVGIAVQVLPLCHPLRLAEETATVDQLSHGRLILGVGRSGVVRTYEAYGVPYGESRERFVEILRILEQAWLEPDVSFAGRYYQFEHVTVVPKPFQKPHPPIRIAATTSDTFAVIGAMGFPIFASVRYPTWEELAPLIRSYREAYAKAGHPGRGEVFVSVPTYLAETEREARADPEESIMHFYRQQVELLTDSAARSGTRAIERRSERAERLRNLTYDDALRGNTLIGTPATIGLRLRELQEELGLDGILAEMNSGGMLPHDKVMRSLRLLCEEVMPQFKTA